MVLDAQRIRVAARCWIALHAIGCARDDATSGVAHAFTGAEAGAPADTISKSCRQRDAAARSLIAAATMGSELSCASDADCTWAPNSTRCSWGCGVLVNRAGERALGAAIDQANSSICDTDPSCLALPTPCPPSFGGASCIAGTCQSTRPAG